jgi:transcriptional regulator with XRE-family HTH domain
MTTVLPLAALINRRLQALGLTEAELGARLGLAKPARAAGRVAALKAGSLTNRKSRAALARLAQAIEVDATELSVAVTATEQIVQLYQAAERRRQVRQQRQAWQDYCNRFTAHAVIDTELERPSSITMCGILGGPAALLVLPLDTTQPPESYPQQALDAMFAKVQRWGNDAQGRPIVPFFGLVQGLTVNYGPNRAIGYDLQLHIVKRYDRARRTGHVTFRI